MIQRIIIAWDIAHMAAWIHACEREGIDTTALHAHLQARRVDLALTYRAAQPSFYRLHRAATAVALGAAIVGTIVAIAA